MCLSWPPLQTFFVSVLQKTSAKEASVFPGFPKTLENKLSVGDAQSQSGASSFAVNQDTWKGFFTDVCNESRKLSFLFYLIEFETKTKYLR